MLAFFVLVRVHIIMVDMNLAPAGDTEHVERSRQLPIELPRYGKRCGRLPSPRGPVEQQVGQLRDKHHSQSGAQDA